MPLEAETIVRARRGVTTAPTAESSPDGKAPGPTLPAGGPSVGAVAGVGEGIPSHPRTRPGGAAQGWQGAMWVGVGLAAATAVFLLLWGPKGRETPDEAYEAEDLDAELAELEAEAVPVS